MRLVLGVLLEEFCIVRRPHLNPLVDILTILTNPTLFSLTRKLTKEQFKQIDLDPAGFL